MPSPREPRGEPAGKKSFDERMDELGRLVADIEGGALGLEASMERYQQGMQLYKELKSEIEAHRQRFQELLADGSLASVPRDRQGEHPGERAEGA